MTGLMHEKEFSRKSFVKGGGALDRRLQRSWRSRRRQGARARPATRRSRCAAPATSCPTCSAVDSWIAVAGGQLDHRHPRRDGARSRHPDRHPHARRRRAEHEHGSDDLCAPGDVAQRDRRRRRLGGISSRSTQTRAAAAYAKQVLLGLASTKLGVPVASLSVSGGVVTGGRQAVKLRRPARRASCSTSRCRSSRPAPRQRRRSLSPARASRSPSASTRSSASRSSGSTSRRRSTAPTPTSTTSASRTCSMLVRCGRVAQAPTPR